MRVSFRIDSQMTLAIGFLILLSGSVARGERVAANPGDILVLLSNDHVQWRRPDGSLQQTLGRDSGSVEVTFSSLSDFAEPCTILYASEAPCVHRYDRCANTPMTDFNSEPLPGPAAFAVRLLPDGGLLVANSSVIARLDAAGRLVQTYDAPGEDCWFHLALDPGGNSFWAAGKCTPTIYKFDLVSTSPVLSFDAGVAPLTVKGLTTPGRNGFRPVLPAGPVNHPVLNGRMTGGGSILFNEMRVTTGFELQCDVTDQPSNLEMDWGPGNHFHLDTLIAASCENNPGVTPNPPPAPFDTFSGFGTGRFNGTPGAMIQFSFVDAGEPGTKDSIDRVTIMSGGSAVLLIPNGNHFLTFGNFQAHATQ